MKHPAWLILTLVPGLLAPLGVARAQEFTGTWPKDIERTWAGPEYWANRLQDWRVAGGRLECITSGADRNVHLLTRDLGPGQGDLRMSVRLGALREDGRPLSPGWAGFRVGVQGRWNDYRDNVRRSGGLDAGITTAGQLFIGRPGAGGPAAAERGIRRTAWKVHAVDSEETAGENSRAANAFDGRPGTVWHSQYREKRAPYPHELAIDLGAEHEVCGFAYLPRQDVQVGRIKQYEFYVGADGKEWGPAIATGQFEAGADLQEVRFDKKRGRYVRLVAKSGLLDRPACAIAELYVLDTATAGQADEPAPAPAGLPLEEVELRLTAKPRGDAYEVTLAAHDPRTGGVLAEVSRTVAADALAGNLALVCHADTGGRGGQAAGGNARFWFRQWQVAGAKVEAHDDHVFGPILWSQYTLSRGVLKMTAQMPPIGETDAQAVRLQMKKASGGEWETLGEAKIDPLSRTATFRVEPWDSARDTPYRLVYAFRGADGRTRDCEWSGTVRRDPIDKETVVVAAFTGNADPGFPNNEVVEHVRAHDPDLLFFSGDNIYENVGGYGTQRAPLSEAVLDYLRKWYFYGWAFRDLLRDRPTVSIPDDHDVYQGNLWGAGGRRTEKDDQGGYVMPAEWVKAVERTQTSHLPDPYDPRPIEQGIGVYYTDLLYGRVSFAILEDRKFKSGPSGLVPPTTSGRADHVLDPNFDPKLADVPGAQLLGERQETFLRAWAADWRGADFKCALSQTIFCGAATHHGGDLKRLYVDYDCDGWPQTARNRALDLLRRGFALHIGGDQHLATIVHHGIDDWNDAIWSFAVPSVANFYLRGWMPEKPGRNRAPGSPEYTGEFLDGLGNRITVWAATNPGDSVGVEPKDLHDKKPGYGIVLFNKTTRQITLECWPRFSDPKDPTAIQYPGWPRTIAQTDNDGRKAAAHLPTLKVSGLKDPVVQVVEEPGGEVVYTLRLRGDEFRPKVFKAGSYTVRVGEPGTDKMREFRGVAPVADGEARTLDAAF